MIKLARPFIHSSIQPTNIDWPSTMWEVFFLLNIYWREEIWFLPSQSLQSNVSGEERDTDNTLVTTIRKHLHDAHHRRGTVKSALHMLPHLIFTTSLRMGTTLPHFFSKRNRVGEVSYGYASATSIITIISEAEILNSVGCFSSVILRATHTASLSKHIIRSCAIHCWRNIRMQL